jgi:hypothetical protein
MKETKGEGTLLAFKQADGQYRWVLKSSNAFEDRDGEVVTTKALNRDVMRTDRTGEYGPLRWWHVGKPEWRNPLDWRTVVAGKGLDLGDTDFSAMDGPILIESGTFKSAKVGAAVAANPAAFKASLGFSHPLDEPDQDGVFHHINRFERSLTPANKASNPRTGLVVTKERTMDQDKLAKFKELIGEEAASEALGDAQSTTKEAREAGIREKAQGTGEPTLDSIETQFNDVLAQFTAFKAAVAPKDATATNVPVKGPPATAPSAIVKEEAADDGEPDGDEGGDEEGGDEVYVGDMTGPEFVGMLQQALGPMFESHTKALDLHGKLSAANDAMKEMKSYLGGMTQKDSQVAELREQVSQLSIALKEATEMLTDLTGEMPKELNRPRGASYKASEGVDNVLPPTSPMFQQEDVAADQSPLSWIDSFVVHTQQQSPVQNAAVVQPLNGRVG